MLWSIPFAFAVGECVQVQAWKERAAGIGGTQAQVDFQNSLRGARNLSGDHLRCLSMGDVYYPLLRNELFLRERWKIVSGITTQVLLTPQESEQDFCELVPLALQHSVDEAVGRLAPGELRGVVGVPQHCRESEWAREGLGLDLLGLRLPLEDIRGVNELEELKKIGRFEVEGRVGGGSLREFLHDSNVAGLLSVQEEEGGIRWKYMKMESGEIVNGFLFIKTWGGRELGAATPVFERPAVLVGGVMVVSGAILATSGFLIGCEDFSQPQCGLTGETVNYRASLSYYGGLGLVTIGGISIGMSFVF